MLRERVGWEEGKEEKEAMFSSLDPSASLDEGQGLGGRRLVDSFALPVGHAKIFRPVIVVPSSNPIPVHDFQSGELDRIFSVKNTDGKTSLMIKESLNKMLRKWDALLPEVGENDFCTPNLALRCLYILEGLMWFSIDQYLDYLDEGGPVCVHSSFWGRWSSLGGMIENEPYLVYGGEWECLHEGDWDDPRKKEQDLHFMQTTQSALVGEGHVGFELLEPIFVG